MNVKDIKEEQITKLTEDIIRKLLLAWEVPLTDLDSNYLSVGKVVPIVYNTIDNWLDNMERVSNVE